jgi:hypothetical protein
MLHRIAQHLSFANVLSLAALFLALGGSSYAAIKINGAEIRDRSVPGSKLRRDTLGGVTIKESRLGKVRRAARSDRARQADRLQGRSAGGLTVRCPAGTVASSGTCLETATRPPAVYAIARVECGVQNRRVPTYEEIANLLQSPDYPLPNAGELTSTMDPSSAAGWPLDVLVVTSRAGGWVKGARTGVSPRPFRCAATPSN